MTTGLLLLGLLLLILLFYLVGSVAPTVTQFFMAYAAAKRLANGRRWHTVSYVAVILIFFTLVLRAGSLWSDLYFKWSNGKKQIYRQLVLNEGDRIAVDINAVAMEYKPEYAKAPTMGGNEGIGFRWEGVSLQGDYFGNTLADTSLNLDTSAPHAGDIPIIEIRITPDPDKFSISYFDAHVKITDQQGVAAEYVTRIRRRFPGEPEDSWERRSGEQESWLVPFLFHSTPVNRFLIQPLATWLGLDNPEPPISNFITQAIQVIPRKMIEPDKKFIGKLVESDDESLIKRESRLRLEIKGESRRSPVISCANEDLRIEGRNPLTIWNRDGTMRRIHLARKEIPAAVASLVVCGTAGQTVVAKSLRDGHAWIYKYDHDWNLLAREEITNVVLWEKRVTQFREEGQYSKLVMYDKVGNPLTYHIPKSESESAGFADRFSEGYVYLDPAVSEQDYSNSRDSVKEFLLSRSKNPLSNTGDIAP